MQRESEWQTKALTEAFLEGVRGAIPGADLQLAVIGKITQEWSEEPTRILNLGCGVPSPRRTTIVRTRTRTIYRRSKTNAVG